MLARKEHDKPGTIFPDTWINEVSDLLHQIYEQHLLHSKRELSVYGEIFNDEVLLILSLCPEGNASAAHFSIFLSADLTEKSDPKKVLDQLIDYSDVILNNYLRGGELDNFGIWFNETINKLEFFYKLSKENVALTLEANKLLKDS